MHATVPSKFLKQVAILSYDFSDMVFIWDLCREKVKESISFKPGVHNILILELNQ